MVCPRCLKDNTGDSRFCAACGSPLSDSPPPGATLTLPPSHRDFATGELFAGRYRIIEELGHGGMGRVFKAHDDEVGEKIALKLIRPDIAGDPAVAERFRNELKLARRITHPNVCRVFDLGEDRGKAFFTMEYVEGKDLAHVLRMTGPLTAETALGYAAQICEGLAAAHRLGVVHRDLKPHNVMVDDAGGVKIMDFGIARAMIGGEAPSEGRRVGTPDYMSPEQAAGRSVDGRTDIYALGLILYEMVTGKRLFPSETPPGGPPRAAVLRSAVLDPRMPENLGGLIVKCLAEDPAGRFQTAADLREALAARRKAAGSMPVGWRLSRDRPLALARKAAPWLLLLLLAAALFVRWPSPGKEPEDGPLRPEAENRLAILTLSDLSSGSRKGIYGEGITDDIRARLGAADIIKLISKKSCELIREDLKDLPKIGRRLQARHVLFGSFAVENDALRVTLTLGDAATNIDTPIYRHVEKLDNLFDVEDRIAAAVADKLKVTLSRARLDDVKKKDPVNVEAKTCYLEGQNAQDAFRASFRPEDYARAERLYLRAAQLSPRYALAYVGLGNLDEAVYVRAGDADRPKALERMRAWFQKAVAIEPGLAEADVGLGLTCLYEGNRTQAARHYQNALRNDPGNSETSYGVGAFLRTVGLYDRALARFLKAAELDPINSVPMSNAASCYWYLGEYDKAEAILRSVVVLDPKNYRVRLNLARQMLMRSRLDEAATELASAGRLAKADDGNAQVSLQRYQAWLAAARGERDRAMGLIKADKQPFRYEATNALCLLGLKDEALRLMDVGFKTGFFVLWDYVYTYLYLANNPLLSGLRDDPRYQDLLERAKADYDLWTKLCAGL